MKHDIVSRGFLGACISIALGQLITVVISLGYGTGEYIAVIPGIQAFCSTECAAILVQILWLGAIGVAFAEAFLIFEQTRWSAVWQYVAHFLVTGAVYLPFVILVNLPLQLNTVLIIAGSILLTYGIAWGTAYAIGKRSVDRINAALERRMRRDEH